MSALKQAEIIPISKGKGNMTDKFEEGHVRSSWQYRRDVYPFLSDAARHVYFMLEGYINGFNKESDYVSYSQLQEEKRHKDNPKARKSSSKTVSKGLEELISLGVISVISTHPKLGNQYKINEVSLSDHFTKESTSPSTALYLVKHEHFTKESTSTLPSKDTIDNTYRNIYRESDSQQNQVEEVLKIWEPDLHQLNSWMQRSGLPKINQAQVEELLLEINPHYESKIHTGAVTSTQMYSNFVKWVKRDYKLIERLFQQANGVAQNINPSELKADMGDW
ncbi:hypothetical protein ACWPO4_17820 [Acinetobacter nosocomialis]|jgi:hypothetical protein|uniref:hypothetical protein n=1 Tax=Acinetobacter calcoaceticus/baumannii complex TaxID=909768 RepID=UPI00073551F2|nr:MULTISPECIES: hypothetical protein [Acinetobacter calcoaceticus/baumannii complex]HAV6221144.1 hypothetical protein [Acinetobacter baumannii]PNN10536.1 hypothetical protein AL489_011540 [Acinetobacter sp. FDAARGOS_131]QNX13409.1 hypothetical protein IC794_06500 [Acinetobacter seifertii]QNX46354.1 hypothetical protein IC785_06790 [Acinetobacter seifertii]QNX53532.1 hypothetical protein IC783_06400 [Acinetobacter seifertii]